MDDHASQQGELSPINIVLIIAVVAVVVIIFLALLGPPIGNVFSSVGPNL